MSEKYTLTLYIAPPDGIRVDKDTRQRLDDSEPGHVYYAIQGPGEEKKAYGFSPKYELSVEQWRSWPTNPRFSVIGRAVDDEHKIYANPAYMRTMEITKEQYEKLQAFGKASLQEDHAQRVFALTNGKFSTEKYNLFDNSCVDYVFHALRYGGVYDHQVRKPVFNEYGEVVYQMVSDDGKMNVLFNAETFNKIPLKTIELYDRTPEEIKKAPFPYNQNVLNEYNISPNATQLAQNNILDIQQQNQYFISQGFAALLSDNPQQGMNQMLNSDYAKTFDIQAKQVLAQDDAQKQQELAQVQEMSTPKMVRS